MKNAREFTSWLNISVKDEPRTILYTTRPIGEEIFATIKYYSEVKSVGIEFMRKLGHKKPKESWVLFQSFIRQAENFYESAGTLHYRAAALMYYYAFLNLAKGFICLSDPDYVRQPVHHGLRHKFKKSKFSKQFITTESKGVFPKLYELIIEKKLPTNSRLNIVQLFGYCMDISHEYSSAQIGTPKFTHATLKLLGDTNTQASWLMIAINNFDRLALPKTISNQLLKRFERVKFSTQQAREIFKIYAEAYNQYSFFEEKKISKWVDGSILLVPIRTNAQSAIQGIYEPTPYDYEHTIMLYGSIINGRSKLLLNQTLAIYSAMFYLGSLVRYRPDYLEHILSSKEAWIIERFTKSASDTFLRLIVNYMLSKELIFSSK